MPDSIDSQVPQAVPPQPVAAPPPRSGSSALKIILIIVGIFVALGIACAGIVGYGIYRVAHAVHKDANGNVTITTSTGSMTANENQQFTESDLGIAIYPGATQGKGGLKMTIAGKTMITANYLTPDSEDKVIAFYKDKAGPDAETITTGTGGVISMTNGSDAITVTVTQSPNENDGKTQIVIARTPKS
ncbi:MAG: hypothetical protein ABSB50_20975 [Terracidiphilus sp.]|jgi:hypothetical protein